MLAASYSKRDHVLALTEMQARETGGRFQKHAGTKKGAVQQKHGKQQGGISRISHIERHKGKNNVDDNHNSVFKTNN